MKISRIETKNFRTLENFSLDLRPNYCAISGRNNSGKSAIVKVIQFFFDDRDDEYYPGVHHSAISFLKDRTQWCSAGEVEVKIRVEIDRDDDSELFFVVNKFSDHDIEGKTISVQLSYVVSEKDDPTLSCIVDDEEVTGQNASEILKKFRSAENLVVHNSTRPSFRAYFSGREFLEVLEANFSPEDQQKIADAEKSLQARIKKATKQHKDELEKLLGKLSDKYQVELSALNRARTSRVPLGIKLAGGGVEVPLTDWGSGTQNRTRILMSVLEAVRIRSKVTAQDRSTPVFLVEEPESFLHPSAQAEFGKVLNELAEEFQIQIIATTHSPYMLNQTDPSANVLLERRVSRGILKESIVKSTQQDNWMLPFAENLGIVPKEFDGWRSIFAAHSNRAVLVEGQIDKEYFEFIRERFPGIYQIDGGIEILPYGGKDALKNTSILQFMVKKFGKVFITFDLDALSTVKPALERIGLKEQVDYCSIGQSKPGFDCVEGLLPSSLKQRVFASRHDLVAALTSQDSSARNSAKDALKRELLLEFKKSPPDEKDLGDFKKLFATLKSAFK